MGAPTPVIAGEASMPKLASRGYTMRAHSSQVDYAPTASPKPIGEWRTVDELVTLLRRRADDLNVTRNGIDEVTGLPGGYTGKVLSPEGTGKKMGMRSMELLIAALGLTMLAVENPEAMRRFTSRIEKRKIRRHAGKVVPARKSLRKWAEGAFKGNPELARRLRAAQLIRMSVKERKTAAKRAAKVRWARHHARRLATKCRPAEGA